MKITIDARPAMLQRTGIGHYTYNLVNLLHKIAPEHHYYLCDVFAGMGFYNMHRVDNKQSNTDRFLNIFKIPFPFVTVSRFLMLMGNKLQGKATKIENTDLFFGTNFRAVFADNVKTVITIHDMAHEYFPETIKDSATLTYLKDQLPEVARKADRIIAVSETTRDDIIRFLAVDPGKIRVVFNGVESRFRQIADTDLLTRLRERYGLPDKFMLYVGAIQPRKNISGIVEAYARLCERNVCSHHLVIAGGDCWKSEGLKTQIAALNLQDKVHFLGYVDDSDLPGLYNLADQFVFPSFYEGFGLPVLEAMACGIPVLTSKTSALSEVAGDAAILVDPHSVDEIAYAMERLALDAELRKNCIDKGLQRARLFSWERCAEETLAVLQEAMDVK